MKRLGIVCLYDELGKLHKSDYKMIADLKECVNELVVVINGEVEEQGVGVLRQITSKIYKRPNRGMDIGAYKDVLIDYLAEDITEYDELVLCNNSFFGPFGGFAFLFKEMETRICDFWGINFDDLNTFQFLESYFLVFREKILKSGVLIQYLKEHIDSDRDTYREACVKFEQGFFKYLVECCGYSYAAYCPFSNLNMIVSGNFGIKKYKMPIVKRKFVQKINQYYDNVIDALQYIDMMFNYDISLILEKVNILYGYRLVKKDILTYRVKTENLVEVYQDSRVVGKNQIEEFVNSYKKVYIYGAGGYGYRLYWLYLKNKSNFAGFIVSDVAYKENECLCGMRIHKFSEIKYNSQTGILLGLNRENTIEVLNMMPKNVNYLDLWKVERE